MNIIITGSIAYDYLMRFPGRFTDHLIGEQLHQISLSFLVDDMTKHWGGVAANIAFNTAMLGLRTHLMGTTGRDFPDYRRWLDNVGVDTSTVRQIDEVFTASFFVNTDLDNNQIASFYTGAMAYAKNYSIADVYEGQPDLVVISPNDPDAMIKLARECRQRAIPFMADPSQQIPRFTSDQLLETTEGARILIVNAYEAGVLCKQLGQTIDDLQAQHEILVVTQGASGALIYHQGQKIDVPAFPVDAILDPTGAGDAFRAGFLRGMAADFPLQLCGMMGSLCACYVLEQVGTQNHNFTVSEFVQRFRQHADDEGLLDSLLVEASVSG
ncbi:MAG: ribokinase [Anaerolineaceae bacterium]|nr:ribokinase [Anaerolineaceae bacterium]